MFKSKIFSQQGVTLVETLVGLVVLSVGIGGAASLAASSFASTSTTSKQLVAVGLAREAQEAVRNMRDTNWLKSSSIDTNCYDFATGGSSAQCYQDWQKNNGGRPYDLDPGGASDDYILDFDPGNSSGEYWDFRKATGSPSTRYKVYVQTGSNTQLYTQTSTGVQSIYYRKIILAEETIAPYDQNTGPRLKVTSQVWWTDKGCPPVDDWPGSAKCGLELASFLTNWKNY